MEDKEDEDSTSIFFAQMEVKYDCYRKPQHKYSYCRTKDKITKYESAINKYQQHVRSKITR